nr:hypothetical protein [Acholeplasmatales bacterium]
ITDANINAIAVTKENDYKMVTDLCASLIMSNILSDKIIKNEMVIVNSTYAQEGTDYRTSATFYVIENSELEAFLKSVADLELGPVGSITEDSVNNITLSEAVAKSITDSEIMNDVAAKDVISNESVVITIDVYETFTKISYNTNAYETSAASTITNEELYLFLIAANKGLNITNISEVNEENITIPDTVDDNLTNSDIMCATISSKIKCDDKYVFVQDDITYIDKTRYDKDNNNINVVSEQEIQDFINGSNALDPEDHEKDYNTTISISTLKQAQTDNVLGDITISNILRIQISDVLTQETYAPYVTETPEYINAIRIVSIDGEQNYKEGTQPIFSVTQIDTIVSALPST